MPSHIVIGIIFNEENKILIAKRAAHQDEANLWEFPGGKVEPGESPEQALKRELKEEVNIDVIEAEPFVITVKSQQSTQDVIASEARQSSIKTSKLLLDLYKIKKYKGEAKGLEGQPIKWVSIEELKDYDFPKANDEILEALRHRHSPA